VLASPVGLCVLVCACTPLVSNNPVVNATAIATTTVHFDTFTFVAPW